MNSAQSCIECCLKDEKIQQLQDEILALKEQISQMKPINLGDQNQTIMEEDHAHTQRREFFKCGEVQQSFIEQVNRAEGIRKPHIQRQQTAMPRRNQVDHTEHKVIGERFFEYFMIIGPDCNASNIDPDAKVQKVPATLLFQYPEDTTDIKAPLHLFEDGITLTSLTDSLDAQLKQIVMQTLQCQKGENEFIITLPREDLNNKPKLQVSEFVLASNLNTFRYLICFQITDFYTHQDKCYEAPVLFCFVTYNPFIKFFMKEHANIWNLIKIERLAPIISDSPDAIHHDIKFMVERMRSEQVINKLFTMRSIKVKFDATYTIGEYKIQTPKMERAAIVQFQWGSNTTLRYLSFKELRYLLSYIMLGEKTIILSRSRSLLTQVLLTLISLMYPFQYLNPVGFIVDNATFTSGLLCSPQAFLFGVVGNYKDFEEELKQTTSQEDISFFDLDDMTLSHSQVNKPPIQKNFPPFKKLKHLRQSYYLINPSQENRFKSKSTPSIQKAKSTNVTKAQATDTEIEIHKAITQYWINLITSKIPIEKQYLNKDIVNMTAVIEVIEKQPGVIKSKQEKRFMSSFFNQLMFTGHLDEIYTNLFNKISTQ